MEELILLLTKMDKNELFNANGINQTLGWPMFRDIMVWPRVLPQKLVL